MKQNTPSIFKLSRMHQNRAFNYTPRYYDEDKERLQKRINIIEQDIADAEDGTLHKEKLREDMRASWKKGKHTGSYKANTRLFILLGLICVIAYFAFHYVDLLLPQ